MAIALHPLHPNHNDEMDDVADWAKEAARKILQPPESVRAKINKIFKSTPRRK